MRKVSGRPRLGRTGCMDLAGFGRGLRESVRFAPGIGQDSASQGEQWPGGGPPPGI